MYIDDFMLTISKYYGIKIEVSREIKQFLIKVKENDLNSLWDYMRLNISPSKRIGVSDIYGACKFLNINVKHNTGFQYKVHPVECEVCGSGFNWKMYASEYDNKNGIYEKCPKCRFPYEDSWVVAQYENSGLNQDFGKEHREHIKTYRETHLKGGSKYEPFETDIDKIISKVRDKLHLPKPVDPKIKVKELREKLGIRS